MKQLSRSQLHDLYYFLRLNRAVDEQLVKLYRQGKVVGGVYSSLGQEAISVGTAYALDSQDFIGPMIRNVGATMVRGYKPRDVFLQYMARQDGPTGGSRGDPCGRPLSCLPGLASGGKAASARCRSSPQSR